MAATGNYIVESDVDNWPDTVSQTTTFATTDVNISTEELTIGIDVATGSKIRFSSTGALPDPLVVGTVYYAIRISGTVIKVALDSVDAAAGTAVDITDVGTGTHTIDVGEGSSTVDRQEIIDRAESLIERVTKDYFYSKTFVINLDGNGQDRLFLGLVPDVLTVWGILSFGVAIDTSWWTYNKNFVYLNPEAAIGSGSAERHLLFKSKQGLFPKGQSNIKVTGTYGWTACPPAIKKAAIILCRQENDPTLYDQYHDFDSEKLGDASLGLGKRKFLTGITEVDDLIREYIRKKPLMGAF